MSKNNLESRIKQWEADRSNSGKAGGSKTELHKPGSQKK